MKIVNKNLGSDYEEINLYVFADLHIGDKDCNVEEIINKVKEVQKDDNAKVILNGDLMNNAIVDSVSDVYGEELIPHEQLNKIIEIFSPIKDKILLVSEGNHEKRTYKKVGISPSRLIAYTLNTTFVEGAWLLFLSFGKNMSREDRNTVYSIYGMHGSGGGKRIGSKVNRVEDMTKNIDADIFIHSHLHTPLVATSSRFRVDYRNRISKRIEQLLVITSAFLNFGGYGEESGFSPVSTRFPIINLKGKERKFKAIL